MGSYLGTLNLCALCKPNEEAPKTVDTWGNVTKFFKLDFFMERPLLMCLLIVDILLTAFIFFKHSITPQIQDQDTEFKLPMKPRHHIKRFPRFKPKRNARLDANLVTESEA